MRVGALRWLTRRVNSRQCRQSEAVRLRVREGEEETSEMA